MSDHALLINTRRASRGTMPNQTPNEMIELTDVIAEMLAAKAGSIPLGVITGAPRVNLDDLARHRRARTLDIRTLIETNQDFLSSKGIEYVERSETFNFSRERWDALHSWLHGR